ncbi:hypothetical protein BLOT_014776 [Blomia tropicalis]|nr:hypothetical protein BLOT_014776 [Blomia tropicalis]
MERKSPPSNNVMTTLGNGQFNQLPTDQMHTMYERSRFDHCRHMCRYWFMSPGTRQTNKIVNGQNSGKKIVTTNDDEEEEDGPKSI